jgi:hypothetical protein
VTEPDEAFGQAFHPERRVRIEEDVLCALVGKDREDLPAQFSPELYVKSMIQFLLAG